MRQRLRPLRARAMARRPGAEGKLDLSPRARRIAGWVAAALIIGVIALAFRLLGGNGDGTVVNPSPGTSAVPAPSIRFGTALDPATGEIASDAETARFAAGDTFAYSVTPSGSPPTEVYVEVRRVDGGPIETVQEPIGAQPLVDPRLIAFSVPADRLLADFGPGRYEMLIYAQPAEEPIAGGEFELIGAESAAPSP